MNGNRLRSLLLKYGVAVTVGGVLAALVIYLQGFGDAETNVERFRILADAFTIPGGLLMLCALLVWIGNQQTFTGLSYVGGRLLRSLVPFARRSEKDETYYDYVSRKRKQGGVKGYGFLFFVGAAFFAVALVFFALFYTVYQ